MVTFGICLAVLVVSIVGVLRVTRVERGVKADDGLRDQPATPPGPPGRDRHDGPFPTEGFSEVVALGAMAEIPTAMHAPVGPATATAVPTARPRPTAWAPPRGRLREPTSVWRRLRAGLILLLLLAVMALVLALVVSGLVLAASVAIRHALLNGR